MTFKRGFPKGKKKPFHERKFNRVPLKSIVFYRYDSSNAADEPIDLIEVEASLNVDISEGGLSFKTDQKLPLNTLLDMIITFNDKIPPLEVTGKIVWIDQSKRKGHNMGIEFISLSEEQQVTLKEDIERYLKDLAMKDKAKK